MTKPLYPAWTRDLSDHFLTDQCVIREIIDRGILKVPVPSSITIFGAKIKLLIVFQFRDLKNNVDTPQIIPTNSGILKVGRKFYLY